MLHKEMEDLLQSQIRESCRLVLPNGLKELMSDISREVLRRQPRNLYGFISEYLAALLVTREHLSVASRMCTEPCYAVCHPELEEELRKIGLDEEDVEKTKNIIDKHFEAGGVKESKLLIKILKNTKIDEVKLVAVVDTVRKAFLRHRKYQQPIFESSSDSDEDDTTAAVRHTLRLYRQTQPSDEDYTQKAIKIQSTYRAYGVRRAKADKEESEKHDPTQKNIRYDSTIEKQTQEIYMAAKCRRGQSVASSSSLAGSYLHVPKNKPYSIFNDSPDSNENQEKEHINIDYVNMSFNYVYDESSDKNEGDKEKKTISFHEILADKKDNVEEAAYESEESVIEEDIIYEDKEFNSLDKVTSKRPKEILNRKIIYEYSAEKDHGEDEKGTKGEKEDNTDLEEGEGVM